MKKNRNCSWLISVALVMGFVLAGCATIPVEPTVVEGYWRFTSTAGDAEAQAVVDATMENVGPFFVFAGGAYYKGTGVLPQEKGTFIIEGSNIVLTPTHNNTGILSNKLSWAKIGMMMKAFYPEKSLPYTLSGDVLKLIDVGIQQAYRKVDPFFSFDQKGNLIVQIK
ncbi:MAG: hypothetical protein LBF78_10610 [Treponema sp.]|nr:hypothetical protein [Treponema sp.]